MTRRIPSKLRLFLRETHDPLKAPIGFLGDVTSAIILRLVWKLRRACSVWVKVAGRDRATVRRAEGSLAAMIAECP